MAYEHWNSIRELREPEPKPARRGSGNHHKHQVPRAEANRLLSQALANFEVGHYAKADNAAKALVSLLHRAMILQSAPKLVPNHLERLEAEKAGGTK